MRPLATLANAGDRLRRLFFPKRPGARGFLVCQEIGGAGVFWFFSFNFISLLLGPPDFKPSDEAVEEGQEGALVVGLYKGVCEASDRQSLVGFYKGVCS